LLEKDDAFLRLTFHECSPDTTDQTPYPNQSDTSYTRAKKEKVSRHFSKTFLNLENTVREAMKDLQSEAIKFVALMAFVLAIFSMFVNLGSAVMGRYVGPRESPRPQPSAQVQDQDNKNLQERVQKLERETQQLIAESVDKTKKGKSVK
jgi:hypothetical protein